MDGLGAIRQLAEDLISELPEQQSLPIIAQAARESPDGVSIMMVVVITQGRPTVEAINQLERKYFPH